MRSKGIVKEEKKNLRLAKVKKALVGVWIVASVAVFSSGVATMAVTLGLKNKDDVILTDYSRSGDYAQVQYQEKFNALDELDRGIISQEEYEQIIKEIESEDYYKKAIELDYEQNKRYQNDIEYSRKTYNSLKYVWGILLGTGLASTITSAVLGASLLFSAEKNQEKARSIRKEMFGEDEELPNIEDEQ